VVMRVQNGCLVYIREVIEVAKELKTIYNIIKDLRVSVLNYKCCRSVCPLSESNSIR
jgi:hypothetical protein